MNLIFEKPSRFFYSINQNVYLSTSRCNNGKALEISEKNILKINSKIQKIFLRHLREM